MAYLGFCQYSVYGESTNIKLRGCNRVKNRIVINQKLSLNRKLWGIYPSCKYATAPLVTIKSNNILVYCTLIMKLNEINISHKYVAEK